MAHSMFLIGHHIGHSFSPAMWNHLFATRGLDVGYGLRDVAAADLEEVRTELESGDVVAANVTMPHKQWAATEAATTTVEAAATGAANFLLPTRTGLQAANTDVVGARTLLAMQGPFQRVTILGAGGTAAAVLAALTGLTDEVTIVNRTLQRGEELAGQFAMRFNSVEAKPWERRDELAATTDLLVNTIPATAGSPIDVDRLDEAAVVYDVNYRAHPTDFQHAITARGMAWCDGLSHLAAQAFPMLRLLPLGLGRDAAGVLVAGLAAAAARPVRAWGGPLPVPLPSRVVLTGFMGTGKSVVAGLLARRLGFAVVDTDQIIEARHGSIPAIFDSGGEAAFRAMERAVVAEMESRDRVVIATGGGLMLDPDNARCLERGGRTFCLAADPATIMRRIEADRSGPRPLLDTPDPARRIAELLAARTPAYRRFIQIDTTNHTAAEVADRIAELLFVT